MLGLVGIKERRGAYDTFVLFTPQEVEEYITLYMIQSLIITRPTLAKIFHRQLRDPT